MSNVEQEGRLGFAGKTRPCGPRSGRSTTLKADRKHASIHLKKIDRFWSARIGLHYRTLAIEVSDGVLWFWIGSHAGYDAFVGSGGFKPPYAAIGAYRDMKTGKIQGFVHPEK
jgi:hypothetical protein